MDVNEGSGRENNAKGNSNIGQDTSQESTSNMRTGLGPFTHTQVFHRLRDDGVITCTKRRLTNLERKIEELKQSVAFVALVPAAHTTIDDQNSKGTATWPDSALLPGIEFQMFATQEDDQDAGESTTSAGGDRVTKGAPLCAVSLPFHCSECGLVLYEDLCCHLLFLLHYFCVYTESKEYNIINEIFCH